MHSESVNPVESPEMTGKQGEDKDAYQIENFKRTLKEQFRISEKDEVSDTDTNNVVMTLGNSKILNDSLYSKRIYQSQILGYGISPTMRRPTLQSNNSVEYFQRPNFELELQQLKK